MRIAIALLGGMLLPSLGQPVLAQTESAGSIPRTQYPAGQGNPAPTNDRSKQAEPTPEAIPSSGIDAEALIEHLQSINARMYGAYWCPHCHEQRALFGESESGEDDRLVDAEIYVECAKGGPTRATPWLCQLYRIRAYPTWIIEGEDYVGVHSLAELAEISGFNAAD
ncbi:MAG: hypothetical protein ACPGVO_09010 [Spirulinaceae cyanobacterium]